MILIKRANSTVNRRIIQLAVLLLSGLIAQICGADAIDGDCENGHGRYDFGFAIYEGDFKNGQPEGLGSLDDGESKYVGEFKNGLQNGNGTLYTKDGHAENVRYLNGQKQENWSRKVPTADFEKYAQEILQIGREEFETDAACRGDCRDGIGIYTFKSGNVYSGHWQNSKREGEGKGTFTNGDVYQGNWHDNLQNGTGQLTKKDGWQFVGTFRDGDPFDGTYTAPNGGTVSQKNGVVQMPPATFAGIPAYINGHIVDTRPRPQMMRCPVCGGDGQIYRVERKTTVTEWKPHDYGPNSVNGYDPNEGYSYHEHTSYEPVGSKCPRCGGSGQMPMPENK